MVPSQRDFCRQCEETRISRVYRLATPLSCFHLALQQQTLFRRDHRRPTTKVASHHSHYIYYTPITIALQTALTYSHHKGHTYVVLYQPIPTKFPRPFGRWLHFASADEGSSRRFLIGGITRRCPTRQFICIDNHPSIPKEVVQR